ncbi:hypothetical protein QQF64_004970 [Cirrhinus molitorella]|uniref:Uncharacterized protein n=1 Tax=Cirrhinus molitorella TaxID=172907 RepID=A0ABR3MHZ2_9TELE
MRKPCPGERNLPLKSFYTQREESEGPPPVPAKTKHCIPTKIHYMLTNRHSHHQRLCDLLQQPEQKQWHLKGWRF